ncbi:ParA family protein [Cyanobacterium aponinum UTEX 3222]|uniref:AAA family ATPase n=2 Tax=Cyanobacterium aponinum TaxID=379064 RepID=A0A844GWG2_9CHRO|nr:ParA family protein [Cyanobacterium aponinum]WRL42758.1 ParA family protein [Cyanobacterium aponinum UTEX 3222]MBD2394783.1 ParA family protein [Cyanobacterium aponinum FACHB-4101]MTF39371.1 AAA family ATPase [Cyanobacterium aponinum 0216]PHV61694.1 chromosome partitioning protein ParA [Cyanobacterium aponinum IPPAS B-1201]WPF88411.1 ParA family protein [Cyanobacterium aponinum AL20115]
MLIAIASLKGGVGKTTTAIHLAAYLQTDQPTLLVDADRNRSALVWAREEKLPFTVASQAGSAPFMATHKHIVTDMRGGPEEEDFVDLAKGNDLMIIPTTPNHLDLDATIKAVEMLKKHNVNNYKILLTKVDSRTSNSRTAKYFLKEQNLPLFKTEIPLLIAFERASQHGKTVKDYSDDRAKVAWKKYRDVGKEIMS